MRPLTRMQNNVSHDIEKHYTPRHLQMTLTDELFLSSVGSVRQYSLTYILEEQNINAQEHQCTQQSSHYDIDKFSEVAKTCLNDF